MKIAAPTNTQVGIAAQELARLTSKVESTLGVKGIASLSGHIEGSLETSIAFHETKAKSDTFDVVPPACGSETMFIYQLIRDYNFVTTKERLFRRPLVTSDQVREITGHFDVRIERDPSDPECPCPADVRDRESNILVFQLGRLSVRVDAFWRSKNALEFRLGSRSYDAQRIREAPSSFHIALRDVPALFRQLSGIDEEEITVTGALERDFSISDLLIGSSFSFPVIDVIVPVPSGGDEGGGTTTA